MNLSGQLADWSISDLLHIMEVTSKTGSLDIEGERRGRVHFRDGKVTGAELIGAKASPGDADQSAVADVLYVLSTMDKGSFSVGNADGPDNSGWTVSQVIKEVDSLREIEEEVVEAGLLDAEGISLASTIETPITIEPADWQTLMNLVRPFTFTYLEETHGRGAAVRILHSLHSLGIATAYEDGDQETEWLDQVADEVAETEKTAAKNGKAEEKPVEEPAEKKPVEEPVKETLEKVTEKSLEKTPADVRGVSAPASTTLTDGVYDEIRRLRSKVHDK